MLKFIWLPILLFGIIWIMLGLELALITALLSIAGIFIVSPLQLISYICFAAALGLILDYLRRVKRRRFIRKQLGIYLHEGQNLRDFKSISITDTKQYESEVITWVNKVAGYIRSKLGEVDESIFRESSGLNLRFPTSGQDLDGRKAVLTYLGFRLQRLMESINKLPQDWL
jgi:hypothetical protein